MMGTTHIVFAFLIYFGLWRLNLFEIDGILLGLIALGSILPDIDHPHGLIYQFLDVPKWLSKGISGLDKHRGKTHTIWAALIVLFVAFLTMNLYFQAELATSFVLFLGYISHLITDSLNKTGVSWFQPFSNFKIKSIISTGSKGESYFFYAITVLIFILFATAS